MPTISCRRWEQRVARASALEKQLPFAAEILRFYQQVAGFQRSLFTYLDSCRYAPGGNGAHAPADLDVFPLLPRFPAWLNLLQSAAPGVMRQAAIELEAGAPDEWRRLLNSAWSADAQPAPAPQVSHLIARAFLQPVAEYLASGFSADARSYTRSVCPFCGRKPVVGALRPEGDGGKRSLVCSLCATEWPFRRTVCAECGEEDVHKQPVYTAADFPHIRVESCDTCKTFIKTVDFTKSGHADALVDEMASVPLTLWAQQNGYRKLQVNLLGM